jgi:hypothetical protein
LDVRLFGLPKYPLKSQYHFILGPKPNGLESNALALWQRWLPNNSARWVALFEHAEREGHNDEVTFVDADRRIRTTNGSSTVLSAAGAFNASIATACIVLIVIAAAAAAAAAAVFLVLGTRIFILACIQVRAFRAVAP